VHSCEALRGRFIRCGSSAPDACGRDDTPESVKDRLNIHATAGSPARCSRCIVDRLPAAMRLSSSSLAQSGSNHLYQIRPSHTELRDGSEHCKTGRCRRIAHRVAPVVEGGRREADRGPSAQFMNAGDLVDFRFPPRCRPCATDRQSPG